MYLRTFFLLSFLSVGQIDAKLIENLTKERAELSAHDLPCHSSQPFGRSFDQDARSAKSDFPSIGFPDSTMSELHKAKNDESKEGTLQLFADLEAGPEFEQVSLISARSPMPAAKRKADIVEEGRGFFRAKGLIGADILQGVGQRLRVNQQAAHQDEDTARKNGWAEGRIIHDLAADMAGAANPAELMSIYKHMIKATDLRQEYMHQRNDAHKIVRHKGLDIENIGLVNKMMQQRMRNNFQPLPNIYKLAEMSKSQDPIRTHERSMQLILGHPVGTAKKVAGGQKAQIGVPANQDIPRNQKKLANNRKKVEATRKSTRTGRRRMEGGQKGVNGDQKRTGPGLQEAGAIRKRASTGQKQSSAEGRGDSGSRTIRRKQQT